MPTDEDITDWPLDQLNDLAIYVYSGVEGVELVADDESDDVAEHGMNSEVEKL